MIIFHGKHEATTLKRVVLVVTDKTPELTRSSSNLENVQLVQATYLNVFTILNADRLIVTKTALDEIKKWLGE
jgi:ribosomal protein L4